MRRLWRNFKAIIRGCDTEPIEVVLSGVSVLLAAFFWWPTAPQIWHVVYASPLLLSLSDSARLLFLSLLGWGFLGIGSVRLFAVLWPLSAWTRAHVSLAGVFIWLFLSALVHNYAMTLTHVAIADGNAALAYWVYV